MLYGMHALFSIYREAQKVSHYQMITLCVVGVGQLGRKADRRGQ